MMPGGGEEAVVPLDQVVGRQHGVERVAGLDGGRALLLVAGVEPALDLGAHALERGGGQDALGRAADAEEDVGARAGPAGGDRPGHVAVGDEADPRAPVARTSAIRASWRGRSRITAVRSRTGRPRASDSAWRFSVGVRRMSQAPLARGPTASFSM